MKWFGMVSRAIAFTHLAPASFPAIKTMQMWVPWQGMYLSYMGSAIAYHDNMAVKPPAAAAATTASLTSSSSTTQAKLL